MISSQQISALIAAQQQQLQVLQRALPGQVPVPNLGASQYPPSFSYGYTGAPTGTGLGASIGGAIGAVPVALGAAQTGAAVASMFGVSNAATSILAPQFGMGPAGIVAGAAVPAALLAGTTFVANNAARGMQEFSGTQAILSQMRFANPAAAGGRGFTTQQQLGMFNMMSRIDAADPFTSMGDIQSMLRGFNDMKMSQGIRDAQEFSDKFKKMTETVKDMAKMMGTTIEGAMQSFGEMRRAGFVSGADLRGNVVDMMIAQGRGIDQGQFLAAQQGGASTLRARGMTGRFGARMVSGVSSAVMGGMQRNLFSGEELMDIFDTSSAGEASLQFGREMTDVLSNFMMTGQGQAFLAATAERGPGGKFTGKLSQQRLTELLRGGNVPDALSQASAAIQGGGRETQLSFMTNKTALANEFMSRDSAVKDVVDMVRQYAERGGVGGDDGTKLILKSLLGIDGRRAEMMMKVAKDYEAESSAKLKAQMQELGTEELAYKLRTRGTIAGIKQYVSGSFSDLGVDIREGSAGLMAGVQEKLQVVQDYFAGVERAPISAASAPIAMRAAMAAPVDLASFGGRGIGGTLASNRIALQVQMGQASPEMFSGGISSDTKAKIDAALSDPAKRAQIQKILSRAQYSGSDYDAVMLKAQLSGALGGGLFGAKAGDEWRKYVMSQFAEGRDLLTFDSNVSKGILFGASPIEQTLDQAGLSSSALTAAKELLTGEKSSGRLALAGSLAAAGIGAKGEDLLGEEVTRLGNLGQLRGMSEEERKKAAAQSLLDKYTAQGIGIEKGSVTAEDLTSVLEFTRTYGAGEASKLFSAARLGLSGEGTKAAVGALASGTVAGMFEKLGMGAELNTFVSSLAAGGGATGFEALLTSDKLQGITADSDPLLRRLGELSAGLKKVRRQTTPMTLEDFAKSMGSTKDAIGQAVSPERLSQLLQDNVLNTQEMEELYVSGAAGSFAAEARQRTGGVVFDKDNPQPAINDQIYNNLVSLTEQNRLNLQVAQSKAGAPVVATPGNTVIR